MNPAMELLTAPIGKQISFVEPLKHLSADKDENVARTMNFIAKFAMKK